LDLGLTINHQLALYQPALALKSLLDSTEVIRRCFGVADFQIGNGPKYRTCAGLETCDTAGLEACATGCGI